MLWAALLASPGCGAGVPQDLPSPPELSEHEKQTYARRHLLDARALRDEGRLEAAARVTARGLALEPDNVALQRLRADLLEALGRTEEARAQRLEADRLDPPPPPPPDAALPLDSEGVWVALLTPPFEPDLADRLPRDWPAGPVATTLQRRLLVRLPRATLHPVPDEEPESVDAGRERLARDDARAALSLRVDRAYCGESLKDGRFAVAWLRVAAAAAVSEQDAANTADARPAPLVRLVRTVVDRPATDGTCREQAVARALEDALGDPAVRAVLDARPVDGASEFTRAAVRVLFPSLGRRVVSEVDRGREQLRLGALTDARAHFRAAVAIDPDDADARAFLEDVEQSLAMSAELSAEQAPGPSDGAGGATATASGDGAPDALDLEPMLPESERRRLEARLREEQRRREELLAALAALDQEVQAPGPDVLATLRPVELTDPDAVGARLARLHSGRDGEAVHPKVLYTPDGHVVARYYAVGDDPVPVLREDDTDGDGRPDRWTAYRAGARRTVWEDRSGDGRPDVTLTFADGGEPLERLEIDADGDGRSERVFRYEDGRLASEERDTNGDGRADLFERFDAGGSLVERDEDRNGDGRVDVRTVYRDGRIVRREILDPDAVEELR